MAEPNEVKLLAVGDIMLGDHPVRIGHGVRSIMEKRGMKFPFQFVSPFLNSSDIVFGNLESVLSDSGLNPSRLEQSELRGRPIYAKALANAGFTVLSLANNHAMQHGVEAFRETVAALAENKVFCVGVKDQDGRSNTFFWQKNNLKLGLISYSLQPEHYHQSHPCYALGREEDIISHVKELRAECDIIVVSIHWGEEYLNIPSCEQIKFGRGLADSGANLIIGHHPHVLQGIEKYGESYIAYSLGNFVFDKWQKRCRESVILECIIDKKGIKKLRSWPVLINRAYQPEMVVGSWADAIEKNLEKYSSWIQRGENLRLENYERKARKAYFKFRMSCYFYFIMNIYRYSPEIILQSLTRSLRRRFGEKRK